MNGIHLFFAWFIEPRSADEDDRRSERILNVLLVASILLTAYLTLSASRYFFLLKEGYSGIPPLFIAGLCAIFCVLLYASRKGFFRASSYLLILIFLAPTLFTSFQWGADLPWGILGGALVITMASVLIGTRFSLVVAGLISLYWIVISVLMTRDVYVPQRYWREEVFSLADTIVTVVLMASITLVAWLSSREIERSLARARVSEKALKHERDLLEIKVEERTQQVKRLQMEQLSHQYRFIEFGRLASGFFHDLATPLNVVSLHLERLKGEQGDEINTVKTDFGRILENTRRMESFLQDIRKQVQQQDSAETFSLVEEIHSVVRILQHKAMKNRVEIVYAPGLDIPFYGSPIKFNKVVTNLVSNAIDAYESPETAPDNRNVVVTLEERNGEIECVIQDWGRGISEEHLVHIFEPFFTTKNLERGTGIGLTIVKEIIEKDFEGTIRIDSHLGKGTVFTLRFPLIRPPA